MIDSLVVPDFWDLYRSPPEYRCAQSSPVCTLGPDGRLDWDATCGPFSMVRARRDLARCLLRCGLPELAARSFRMRVGSVEAAVNAAMLDAGKNTDRFFELQAVRNVARRIRKPINDACDYEKERDYCLSM